MPTKPTRGKFKLPVIALALGVLSSLAIFGTSGPAQASDEVTAIILATSSANGADARQEYSAKVNPLGKEAGVKIVKGVKVHGSLVGQLTYKAVFLLSFASEQVANDFFSSEKYKALIPLRDEGYDQYDVLIGK